MATPGSTTGSGSSVPTTHPTNEVLTQEDKMDIVAVGLVMLLPFLVIPSIILLFRTVKRMYKWFKTHNRHKRVDRYIDAELSWIAKMIDHVRHAFEMSWLGRYWSMLQAYFTVASLIFYIVGTYTRRIEYAAQVLQSMQMMCACVFICDYALLALVAQDRLRFFFSIYSIIDLLSIMPAFTHFFMPPSLIGVYLFEIILVFPALRILRFDRILFFTRNEVQREIGLLALPFLSLLFLATSIISAVQTFNDANGIPGEPANISQFHDAMYFIIVTVSTVGYGDVAPQSVSIRMMLMCLIVVFLIMLPIYTGRLVEVLSKRATPYERNFQHSSPHFVVIGNVTFENTLILMRELLNNINDGGKTKVLLFSTAPTPSKDLRMFLDLVYFRYKVTYLQGSPLQQADLERASLAQAKAVFIVAASAMDETTTMTDATVALYASTVKRYTPETPVFVQLHTPEAIEAHVLQRCDRILCIEDLKMALLGWTCIVPGTLTFVTNIFSTFRQPSETAPSRWQEEYAYGSCHSVVPFVIPSAFAGEPFHAAALAIFADHGAMLIAVKRDTGPIIVAPSLESGFSLQAGDIGFMLCHDGDSIPANYYDSDDGNASGALHDQVSQTDYSESYDVPLNKFFGSRELTANKSNTGTWLGGTSDKAKYQSSRLEVTPVPESHTSTAGLEAYDFDRAFDSNGAPRQSSGGSKQANSSSSPPPDAAVASSSNEQILFEDILAQPLHEGEFEQHVIICGLSLSLATLIRPLRSSRLRRKQPVVVISEFEPDPDLWAEVEALEHVYLVQGAARKPSVLKRAGITTCSTVIILLDKSGSHNEYDYTADAEVVYISKLAAEMNRSANIITELMHYFHLLAPEEESTGERITRSREELDRPELPYRVRYTHMLEWKREHGVKFYTDKDESDTDKRRAKEQIVEYSPDGTRFVREIDRSQSNHDVYEPATSELTDAGMEFYRPYMIDIVHGLLSMTQHSESHLFIKPVPEKFVNTSYIELTSHLLRHGIVPVALYRPAEFYGNPQPYVYTNPKRLTRLAAGDRVLFLASREPSSVDDKGLSTFNMSLMATHSKPVL